jgi:hypothetical protein
MVMDRIVKLNFSIEDNDGYYMSSMSVITVDSHHLALLQKLRDHGFRIREYSVSPVYGPEYHKTESLKACELVCSSIAKLKHSVRYEQNQESV